MALYYETDIPGGILSVTVDGNTITATFDYPGICGDRTHEVEASDRTLEAFCQSETVTVEYDDFDGDSDALILFRDTATGTAYVWDIESEHPKASNWEQMNRNYPPARPWWLEAARNVLRP